MADIKFTLGYLKEAVTQLEACDSVGRDLPYALTGHWQDKQASILNIQDKNLMVVTLFSGIQFVGSINSFSSGVAQWWPIWYYSPLQKQHSDLFFRRALREKKNKHVHSIFYKWSIMLDTLHASFILVLVVLKWAILKMRKLGLLEVP